MFHKKNQNISSHAFTLVEMLIVLVIMGILLMFTAFLSWEQIQKIKNKSVKESILSEWQSRYSRNLWSSSFAWKMYDNLEISVESGQNEFDFKYVKKWEHEPLIENTFTERFVIKYITLDYKDGDTNLNWESKIMLEYSPYKISCKIWENKENVVFVIRVNESEDYCFNIDQKNCRLSELPKSSCTNLKKIAKIDNQ